MEKIEFRTLGTHVLVGGIYEKGICMDWDSISPFRL